MHYIEITKPLIICISNIEPFIGEIRPYEFRIYLGFALMLLYNNGLLFQCYHKSL